jgi:hypothetical protein
MEPKARRQRLVLAALIAVLAYLTIGRVLPALTGPAAPPTQAAVTGGAGSRPAGADAGDLGGEIHTRIDLARLDATSSELAEIARNPFRFGQQERIAEGPGAGELRPPGPTPPPGPRLPSGPPGPPPLAPIPFKFIGIVTLAGNAGRVAVLSDGLGVYHGREGEVVEGQYRIVQIGEESVQMEYADGRGRQTIRLSGS